MFARPHALGGVGHGLIPAGGYHFSLHYLFELHVHLLSFYIVFYTDFRGMANGGRWRTVETAFSARVGNAGER